MASQQCRKGMFGKFERLADGGLQFQPKCHVSMMKLSAMIAAPFSVSRQIARQLLQDRMAKEVLGQSIEMEPADSAHAAAMAESDATIDSRVLEALQSPMLCIAITHVLRASGVEHRRKIMCQMVKYAIRFDYIGEALGDDQVWYVD